MRSRGVDKQVQGDLSSAEAAQSPLPSRSPCCPKALTRGFNVLWEHDHVSPQRQGAADGVVGVLAGRVAQTHHPADYEENFSSPSLSCQS